MHWRLKKSVNPILLAFGSEGFVGLRLHYVVSLQPWEVVPSLFASSMVWIWCWVVSIPSLVVSLSLGCKQYYASGIWLFVWLEACTWFLALSYLFLTTNLWTFEFIYYCLHHMVGMSVWMLLCVFLLCSWKLLYGSTLFLLTGKILLFKWNLFCQ